MKLLAFDCSAKTACVAILNDNNVIYEKFENTGYTHSQTLLPMINDALEKNNLKMSDIGLICVTNGPGSFTGVRIGLATAKGLSFKNQILISGVSTLKSLAYNFIDEDCYVISALDARADQIYAAMYNIENKKVDVLIEDTAIGIDDFIEKIKKLKLKNKNIYISGDGAKLLYDKMYDNEGLILADINKRFPLASSVGCLGYIEYLNKKSVKTNMLKPVYLRLSQAERLKAKKDGGNKMIAIGSDHAGYSLKMEIIKHLEERKLEYKDYGTYSLDSCHYPDYGKAVALAIKNGECDKGILICGTGIGISMAANKVHGIRAAVCSDTFSAKYTRLHNDANIIAMGERVVGPGLAIEIVDTFLDTPFEGGRHQKRIDMISDIEKENI